MDRPISGSPVSRPSQAEVPTPPASSSRGDLSLGAGGESALAFVTSRVTSPGDAEVRFPAGVHYTPEIIARFDRDFRYFYVNPAIQIPTGLPPEHFLGKSNREAGVREDVCQIWEEALEDAFAGNRPRIEFDYPVAGGGLRRYEAFLVPEQAPDGTIPTVLVVARDVTELRRAESSLPSGELRLWQAMQASPCFSFEWNTLTDEVVRSPECAGILGLVGDAIVHDSGQRYLQRVLAEDRERFTTTIGQLTPTAPTYSTSYRLVRGDGSVAFLEETARALFDDGGQLVRLLGVVVDATARRQAEEIFRKREAYYRSLFDNMQYAVAHCQMLFDASGHPTDFVYLDVNEAFRRITGLRDVIGKRASELIPEIWKAHPEMLEIYGQVARTGKPEALEIEFTPLAIWLSISVYSPTPDQFVAVFDDISPRKQAEVELRASEAKSRYLHQTMRDAFCCVSMDGAIQEFNEAYCTMLGYSPQELRSLRYQDITPEPWHSYEAEIIQNQVLARGYSDIYQKEYRRKDGTVFPVELRTILIPDAEGRPFQMWAIIRDISERRCSEALLRQTNERLALAQRAAGMGTWDWDVATDLLTWSPEMFTLFGLDPQTATASLETWRAILYPDDREPAMARLGEALRERAFLSNEYRVVHPEGQIRWISALGKGVYDEAGQPLRMVGVCLDITERKQAEQQLQSLNETLEQRVQERTAEAEWRATQLQHLAAQITEAEERERRRLSQILHDHLQQLLVAARFRLGRAASRAQDEGVGEAIAESLGLVDEAIAESRSLTKELSPPALYDGGLGAGLEWLGHETERKYRLPVTVHVEPEVEPPDLTTKVIVFQAARELILNAVKHASASTLKVSLSRADEERLAVTVEDDGTGFDVATLHGKGGGGFGLFSIRERLDVSGGQLTLASTPWQGTKATILAPCRRARQPKPSTEPLRELPLLAPEAASSDATRIRVLLADDHPVLRKGLADMFREDPHLDVVGEASDGCEAIDLALRLRPDVVLMDITMPHLDGIEATRQIKAALPDIRVIGLSMHETEEMITAMRNAGACEYLTKTAPTEAMIAAILQICLKP